MNKAASIILSSVLFLAGCTAESELPYSSITDITEESFTFTDDLNRTVTVEHTDRTAVLLGSFADVWCLAGGKESLCAAAGDSWSDFDLGLSPDVADTGSILHPDLEVLFASEPDFIICSSNTKSNLELQDTLEESGIAFAYFGVNNFNEYLHMLDICTQITGNRENYDLYGTAVQDEIDEAKKKIDGSSPTVLLIRSGSTNCTIKNSEGTVLGEMLADLDTVNIADSNTGLLENISLEAILEADPDYIFAVYQGTDKEAAEQSMYDAVTCNPAWESLTAVQEGRFYIMDRELYHLKPNERWGEAYMKLAGILYE